MKISLPTVRHWQAVLLCFVLSLSTEHAIAQGATNYGSFSEMFYYGIALALIGVIIITVFIMRRARRLTGEYGRPLFNPDYSIFKRMTKSGTTVAIVMILLVLWGIYLVITYKA